MTLAGGVGLGHSQKILFSEACIWGISPSAVKITSKHNKWEGWRSLRLRRGTVDHEKTTFLARKLGHWRLVYEFVKVLSPNIGL
jgi:hypothetical protein